MTKPPSTPTKLKRPYRLKKTPTPDVADVATPPIALREADAAYQRQAEREINKLTAKLSYAITGFNRALDLTAAERIKGGISIETAHDQVKQSRAEFDAGLAAIDARYDPAEGEAS